MIGMEEYHDVYQCYSFIVDDNGEGRHSDVPSFRFYGKDIEDFTQTDFESSYEYNSLETLTIETNCVLEIKKNDIVYSYKDKKKWRVDIAVVGDENEMKKYSARPDKRTLLKLVRKVGE